MNDGIRPLDPRNPRDVEAVARMHAALIPQSPMCRLGLEFMQRFYYRKLVEDGLIHCDLYVHQGTPAGFVAYTAIPSRFMSEGLRRHWRFLAGAMAFTIWRRPQRITVLLQVLSIMASRKRNTETTSEGEILSLGVLPEFRNPEFVRQTGKRISPALFEHARGHFRNRGVPNIYLLVEADNKEAMVLYRAMGGRFEPDADSGGKSLRVVYGSAGRTSTSPPREARPADAPSLPRHQQP